MLRLADGIQIRLAALDDGPALVPLLEQLGYPSTPFEVQERLMVILRHPDYSTWIAEQGERIVGLAGARIGYTYERNGCYGQLMVLVVDAGFRRSGVGTALVRAVEEWTRKQGGIAVLVNSSKYRREAHRFYEQLGYTATGLRFVKELQPE